MRYKPFLIRRFLLIVLIPGYYSRTWAKKNSADILKLLSEATFETSKELVNLIDTMNFKSLLEIGGNCGVRLFDLAAKSPEKNFFCADLNLEALKIGEYEARLRKLKNLTFLELNLQKKVQMSKSIEFQESDLIFSWATLIYIHPMYIMEIIENIVLSKCKTFIAIEQDSPDINYLFKKGKIIEKTNWIRDYEYLFAKSCRRHKIDYELIRLPCPGKMWNPGGMGGTILMFTFFK